MFGRVSRWMLLGLAGVLIAGLVGLSAVRAQTPTPQAQGPACPAGRPGLALRWGGERPGSLAAALGMTPEQLRAAVRDGQTVAQLAEAKGLTIEQLVDKVLAARQARVAEAVEAGRLTQEQADARLAQMRERLTERLQNGTCTTGMRHGAGPREDGIGRPDGERGGRRGGNDAAPTGRTLRDRGCWRPS